jgi:aquaporin Z
VKDGATARVPAPVRAGRHWPEYLIEASGLGVFMVAACAFGTLLGHPGSPVVRALPDALARRAVMGLAMGAAAVALIYSPFGRRSGAHFNPATTFTFWRLGRVDRRDFAWYVIGHTFGALAGVMVAWAALRSLLAHPSVRYVATVPGPAGEPAAFFAECAIAFVLMTTILNVSNRARLARYTGLCVGALLCLYMTCESPISGMSMNPARSLASAVPAGAWAPLWIYLTAPPLGMLLAAEVYVRSRGLACVFCAKLNHGPPGDPCVFRCRHSEMLGGEAELIARAA